MMVLGGGLFLMSKVRLYVDHTQTSMPGTYPTEAARYRGTSLIRNTHPPRITTGP